MQMIRHAVVTLAAVATSAAAQKPIPMRQLDAVEAA